MWSCVFTKNGGQIKLVYLKKCGLSITHGEFNHIVMIGPSFCRIEPKFKNQNHGGNTYGLNFALWH